MGYPSDHYREGRYSKSLDQYPAHTNFKKHTMGARNLRRYIRGKKFSKEQRQEIGRAYRLKRQVRVIGAYRKDLTFLANMLGYDVDAASVLPYHRDGKMFNEHRQLTRWARPRNEAGKAELWILVFPSASYVDHVAELVQAIFDLRSGPSVRVVVWHFPDLEGRLTLWTGFRDTVRSYVRAGDVVAIGNVELLTSGLEDVGFHPLGDWIKFGLDDMFAVRLMRNSTSRSNLVLIGMSECFWGEASAKYVEALLQAGARHILYGSKAATLLGKDLIGMVGTPRAFGSIGPNGNPGPVVQFARLWLELQGMFKLTGVEPIGTGITVPTVLGEDHDQWSKYRYESPACMDCENGHIAYAVADTNRKLSERGSFEEYAKFVPIHFITDHIHRPSEPVDIRTGNLAVKPRPEVRDAAFRRIGQFFGIYTLRFGLRDHIPVLPEKVASRGAAPMVVDDLIENVGELVDSGMGREAALTLLRMFPPNELPPVAVLALAFVAQKCGFSHLFQRAYAEFLLQVKNKDHPHAVRAELLYVKVLTQVGDYSSAEQIGSRLLQSAPTQLQEMHQMGALQRRLAVAYAGQGRGELARIALEHADTLGGEHDRATNQLFREIVELQLVSGIVSNDLFPQISQRLGKIREACGELRAVRYGVWHTNPEKCAIAALFLEAAYYLDLGTEGEFELGMKRLFAAHILNARFGANERSDAFGEVLGAVKRPGSAALLSLAMRGDPEAQFEFQDIVRAKYKYKWSDTLTKSCLDVLRAAPSAREAALGTLWS